MSSFTGLFGYESRLVGSSRPLHDDVFVQRFKDSGDSSPIFTYQEYKAGDDVFFSQSVSDSPPSIYSGLGGGFSTFSRKQNCQGFYGGFGASNGSISPPPAEMHPEEGLALREWRRQNAIRLKEKEKKEKETLQQVIEEAEEYKKEFYRKRQLNIDHKKASNKEKEKLYLENREKFHGEAKKNYWKAIAELIPNEVAGVEKRGKKKASIVVIQGPKPGKPSDLARMRQILVKLKHNPPPQKDVKAATSSSSTNTMVVSAATFEAIAAA
ncbi:clathrin light chain 2-like [Euphorbia lathyris]|uniref:clathrin light chain 2-like n=1 Tax=Euphorbia lathyris TaxID=212925 RepID=UPI003313721F